MTRGLLIGLALAALVGSHPGAQTDLDDLMARVLKQRDESWRQLHQYILDEDETFQLLGTGGAPVYGFHHEYVWFVRDGVFIRSPLRADGVTIGESARRRAEDEWI
jgi:hypothetical protein